MSAGLKPLFEKARAKVNLTLAVGPVDPDGYHPLQSLVVFAEIADLLHVEFKAASEPPTLAIEGPFANDLAADKSNLILRTAEKVRPETAQSPHFRLTKNLPVASGIGGGSADAAATARLLCRYYDLELGDYAEALQNLGSDIPVCLKSQTCIMRGRGEKITELPGLGQLHAVLINTGNAVSTREVFEKFDDLGKFPTHFAKPEKSTSLLDMAKAGRNDLQAAAIQTAPEIAVVLNELEKQDGCQLARMSGSGATCFGLFPSPEKAEAAVQSIKTEYPHWWCVATVLGEAV